MKNEDVGIKSKCRRTLEGNRKESKESGEWVKSAGVGDAPFALFLNILPSAKVNIFLHQFIVKLFSNYN